MRNVTIVAGVLAQMAAWYFVRWRGLSVWRVTPPILAAVGSLAVLVAGPAVPKVGDARALAAGAGSGVALYLGTRLFVIVAGRSFGGSVARVYGEASEVSLVTAVALAAFVTASGEELFWRGLVQPELAQATMGAGGAAVVAWAAFIAVGLVSRSAPVVAAAVVGGAVWAALGWWSGGVLASLTSHILWTAMMVALPPRASRPVNGP